MFRHGKSKDVLDRDRLPKKLLLASVLIPGAVIRGFQISDPSLRMLGNLEVRMSILDTKPLE